MRKLIPVGVALFLTGCASAPLLPAEQRQVAFVDPTGVSKEEAYSGALTYLAKNLGDSNHAIKVQDKADGHIVSQMAVSCPEFKKGSLDLVDYKVQFNVDFQAKEKRIRTQLDDLSLLINSGKSGGFGFPNVTDQETLTKAKACVEPVHQALLRAVNGADRTTAAAKDW